MPIFIINAVVAVADAELLYICLLLLDDYTQHKRLAQPVASLAFSDQSQHGVMKTEVT